MGLRELLTQMLALEQKALVVGLGISGVASARLLNAVGLSVIAIDKQSKNEHVKRGKFQSDILDLERLGVQFHFGIDGEEVSPLLDKVELSVVSPGVSLESAICGALRRRGIKLVSEFELGLDLLNDRKIIVTGSNGKSTTVSLIDDMLKRAGISSKLCGNVGRPIVSEVSPLTFFQEDSPSDSVLVVEASSYQLESCQEVKADVAVLLNLSENHLERHGSLDRYLDVKAKIFKSQKPEGFAFLNADDPHLQKFFGGLSAREGRFGRGEREPVDGPAAFIHYAPESGVDSISYRAYEGGKFSGLEEYSLKGSKLLGLHNRYNAAAAIMSARTAGASQAAVSEALLNFKPLFHRSEMLANNHGIVIVNDSKSTTVASTVAAFNSMREAFSSKKITLLIGGRAKAGSWDPLMKSLLQNRDNVQSVICFGGDGRLLASHCKNWGIPHSVCLNLEQATVQAVKEADQNLLLFSPGCASFDEFSDFEQRGEAFKGFINPLLATKVSEG